MIRQEIANNIINNWIIAKQLVENNGGKFYAILHPTAYVGDNIFHPEFEIYRKDCLPDIYVKINDIIRSELRGEKWFLDLTHIFDGKGPYYIDACHASDQANQLVATEINNYLNK